MSRRQSVFALIVVSSLLGWAGPAWADVDVDLVTDWYKTYLHRPPDESALSNYVSELKRGVLPSQVKAQLLGSDEYFQRYNQNPERFITGLFRDVRSRNPSPDEVRIWLAELSRVGGDREELARQLLPHRSNPGSYSASRRRRSV
jgi:hypothetical protein